jgi:thiol:disulfide interchange protein
MIKAISHWKYWQIIAVGLCSSLTTVLLVAFAARVVRVNWPAASDGIQIAYVIVSAAAAWIVVGIFAEAGFYKRRHAMARLEADAAMDRIMDLLAGHQALGAASPFAKEEADRG